MAFMKCTECGKEVSDKAVMYPHCATPIIDENKEIILITQYLMLKWIR